MTPVAIAGETAHWGYSGHEGPKHWGELDPEYVLCSEGKNQSPVNLTEMIESDLPPIAINRNFISKEEAMSKSWTIIFGVMAANR